MTSVQGVGTDLAPSAADDGGDAPGRRDADRVLDGASLQSTVGAVAVLAVPFVVAVVALRTPVWHAAHDHALIELRVRDVLAGDPPLVGVGARIEDAGVRGHHPGPVLFWLLAPLYWAFGRSSWALQVAATALNLAAVSAAVWLTARRAGRWGFLGAAAGVAVLLHGYGAERWTTPWNPFLAMLWWPVVLLAVWSVLCGDRAMVLLAVVGASICAQAHLGYLGLVGALGAVALGALVWQGVAARHDPAEARRALAWAVAGGALLVLLWLPPLVDQVRGDPGNLSIIRGQFAHPTEPPLGLRRALDVWLTRLDPAALVSGRTIGGPTWPGVLMLAGWGAAAWTAWRRRLQDLVRLHAVVGVALVAGLLSIARIIGRLFDYLVLWSWGTLVVLIGATVATIAAVATSTAAPSRQRVRRAGSVALVGIVGIALVAVSVDAGRVLPPQPGQAAVHADLLPATARALAADGAPGGGRGGRFLLRSDDQVMGGLNTYTMLLDLERHGFDVGVDAAFTVDGRPSRVLDPDDATAILTYVVGPAVETWRQRPGTVELAHAEPPGADADPDGGADRLREYVRDELEAAGLDDLAASWDGNILALTLDTRVPDETLHRISDQLADAYPTSVFLSPPE